MPQHCTAIPDIDRYELATIIAALRLLQATPALPEAIDEIATDCGGFAPLQDWEIEKLCERINAVSEYPWRDITEEREPEDPALEERVAALFEEIGQ